MTPDNGTRQNNVYRLRLPLSRFRDAVPPAEKATARQDQARQSGAADGNGNLHSRKSGTLIAVNEAGASFGREALKRRKGNAHSQKR
jgi:hypothetical protein